jgi:chromate transporter
MQTAAYSGLCLRGAPGAAASFIGFGAPAFIFMMVLSALYSKAEKLPFAVSAFGGLQAIVVSIVAAAAISFGKTYIKNLRGAAMAVCSAFLFGFGLNPFMVVAASVLTGLLIMPGKKTEAICSEERALPKPHSVLFIIAAAGAAFAFLFVTDRRLFELAALMSRIDMAAFGGGFSSLPMMFNEGVRARHWLSAEAFMNGLALGQITPGPIVITATFIGYRFYGALGGAVATIAVFLPSFLLVIAAAPYMDRLRRSLRFNKAIEGVLCSFVGLLISVTIHFGLRVHWDAPRVLLAVATFIPLYFNAGVFWVVLAGGAVSALFL